MTITAPTVWDLIVIAAMVTLAATALVQRRARDRAATYCDQAANQLPHRGVAAAAYRDVADHLRGRRGRWER